MYEEMKDGGKEREDSKKIRAISVHPSGVVIKHERGVMDGGSDMISWGKR